MKKKFIKKNILLFVILTFVVGISLSFLGESVGRSISLTILTASLILTYIFSGNLTFSFLIFLLLALPFNITYQLPFPFENSLVDGISVNYLIPTVSILDFGLGIFLLIVLTKKRGILKSIFLKYRMGFGIFAIFLVLQNVILKNPLVIFSSLRILLYLLTFLLLLELWKEERKKVNLKFTSIILLVTVLLQGVIGLGQFINGSSLGLSFLGETQGVAGLVGSNFASLGGEVFLRASGTFPHPNVSAGFYLSTFFFAYILTKLLQNPHKILTKITMILSFIFTIFTFSRTVILLFVLIFVITFLSKISLKKKAFSFSLPLLFERFATIFSKTDSSWTERIDLAKASFTVIKQNWIMGTGLGNFVKGMEDFYPTTSRSLPLLQPVHNIFLLLFSELGLFGFLSFLYLFFEIFKKNYKKSTIFSFLIFLSILVLGMIDHYLVSLPQGQIIFFFLLFLAIVESQEKLKQYKKKVG